MCVTTATQMALATRTARNAAGESSCQAHGPPGGAGGDGGGGAAGSAGCNGGASTTSTGTDMSATGSRSSMKTNGMTETSESEVHPIALFDNDDIMRVMATHVEDLGTLAALAMTCSLKNKIEQDKRFG